MFTLSHVSATGWTEQKLEGSIDARYFGTSMAATPSKLLVGAPGEDMAQGAVYAFTYTNGSWVNSQEIQVSGTGGDYFGFSVAISGTTAVIGAYTYATPGHLAIGKAYIYDYANGAWSQTAVLNASDAHDYNFFGYSVAIVGSNVLIGAPNMAGPAPGPGAVYVFTRNLLGNWSQSQKLVSSDGATLDRFGYAISMSGSTALIGAPRENTLNPRPGAAYIFTRSGSTWSEQQEIGAGTYQVLDHFGFAVALSSTAAVVGAPAYTVSGHANQGEAFAFRLVNGSWSQSQVISIAQGSAGDQFGWSAAFGNAGLVVGASRATINGQANQGAAYLFTDSNNQFVYTHRFTSSQGTAGEFYGSSVAMSSLSLSDPSTVFVGAPNVTFGTVANGEGFANTSQ